MRARENEREDILHHLTRANQALNGRMNRRFFLVMLSGGVYESVGRAASAYGRQSLWAVSGSDERS